MKLKKIAQPLWQKHCDWHIPSKNVAYAGLVLQQYYTGYDILFKTIHMCKLIWPLKFKGLIFLGI